MPVMDWGLWSRLRAQGATTFLRAGTRDPADGGGRYLITPANPAKKKARKQAQATRRANRKKNR